MKAKIIAKGFKIEVDCPSYYAGWANYLSAVPAIRLTLSLHFRMIEQSE